MASFVRVVPDRAVYTCDHVHSRGGVDTASLTVFFLDVGEFYNVILMPWMFLTPIMYPMDIVPEKYHILIKMNPMYYFIECFRYPIYNGELPSIGIISMSMLAVVTLIIGVWVFTNAEDDFVYYV